jgi:S-adenosylmethionine:tRNA ribosyltransferase-isomerase
MKQDLLEPGIDFALPPELEAHAPPEARGLARDEVRLMVSYRHDDRLVHARFRDLPGFLQAGDVLVINTSGTLPAALPAIRADGGEFRLHLSTRLPGGVWTVELRRLEDGATRPFFAAEAGEVLFLPGGATARLLAPYRMEGHPPSQRLWVASLETPGEWLPYLLEHGKPIRYGYVAEEWPLEFYQTVYAAEMGSAEMPSAGRAFTPEVLTRLLARGVLVVPLLLHTGVASLESHEPPYEEFYHVPPVTAQVVSQARAEGRRVIAVGTTVVRALETVADPPGRVHPGEGWTRLLVTPERGVRAVDGILTGWHEPRATHLALLEAIAGRRHLEAAYRAALEGGYLWHEFGDLHLILP